MNITDKIISLNAEKRKIFLDKIFSEGEKYGIYPLTPNQYSLWCKYRISENITQFTTPCLAVNFCNVTVEKITEAVKKLFELEEVFRYRFFEIDGKAYQYIDNDGDIPLTVTDIPSWSNKDEFIKEAKHRFYITPMNLHKEYPVKFEILKVSPENSILMISMHHLISDAASVGVMLRDLFSLIKGDSPKKNTHYGTYAIYMNSPKSIAEQKKCEEYWINRVSGIDKMIGFPTDFPRIADSSDAEISELTLTSDETTALRNIAKMTKTNMHVVLSSLYSIVVQRFVKKKDVIIASTFFNRKGTDTTSLIGDFASIVPYVFSCDDKLSLLEYIEKNATLFLDALDNSDAVFSRISDALDNSRVKGYNPVYQTAMVYHTKELTSIDDKIIGDVSIRTEDLAIEGNIRDFSIDLYMKVTDLGETVNISAVYRKDLFKRETIINILSIYHNLLKKFIKNPELSLESLILAEKSYGKEINYDGKLTAFEPSDVKCSDEYSYTLAGEKIYLLDENGHPVPIDFFGYIYISSENGIFSTGKYGRIRNDITLEIDEKKSYAVSFRGKLIDLKKAESVLKNKFPDIIANIKYINEDTLILDLECESNYNIKNIIIKELEFEPTLIYQLCDINGERLSKHQFNIIKAMSEAKKIGYSSKFVQYGDIAYIVMYGKKAPSSVDISEIYSDIKDEKILFGFTSEDNLNPTEKDIDRMFIYRKRIHSVNEEKLIEIWRNILNTDDFGIYDSFHHVGGDSLKIYQLLNSLSNSFDVPFNISDLFTYNNINDMAKHIDKLEKRSEITVADTCIICF